MDNSDLSETEDNVMIENIKIPTIENNQNICKPFASFISSIQIISTLA